MIGALQLFHCESPLTQETDGQEEKARDNLECRNLVLREPAPPCWKERCDCFTLSPTDRCIPFRAPPTTNNTGQFFNPHCNVYEQGNTATWYCRHIIFDSAFYIISQTFWWRSYHTTSFEEGDNETEAPQVADSKMLAADAVTRSFIFIREMRQTGLSHSFRLKLIETHAVKYFLCVTSKDFTFFSKSSWGSFITASIFRDKTQSKKEMIKLLDRCIPLKSLEICRWQPWFPGGFQWQLQK